MIHFLQPNLSAVPWKSHFSDENSPITPLCVINDHVLISSFFVLLFPPFFLFLFLLFIMSADQVTQGVAALQVNDAASTDAAAGVTQNVTPWEVEGAVVDGVQQAIDYNKLIDQFGTTPIDAALLERFEKLTGRKPHILLRRGMFFSHR